MSDKMTGSKSLIQSMINQGIKYVFGVPGAKVDQLFEDLKYNDDPKAPQLIVTRHEQNAAFMAQGIGRLTGKPGVAATTSGPGVSNLITGLLTATSEADPVIAIGGQVPRDDVARLTHQSIPSQAIMSSVTKTSVEIQDSNNVSEAFTNAYQAAVAPKAGATFVSIPGDVLGGESDRPVIEKVQEPVKSTADQASVEKIVAKIKAAKMPVILAGMRASRPENADAIKKFLSNLAVPVVETFQGAGIISKELEGNYFGRVGLFRNQIGDAILRESDLVITVGYDPVEYEARFWNADHKSEIVSIDEIAPEISFDYQPEMTIQADIAKTFDQLAEQVAGTEPLASNVEKKLDDLRSRFDEGTIETSPAKDGFVHPLEVVDALQSETTEDTIVTVDVGSFYIWMARYFRSYKPRHLLFSNGMQTLGVSLPWAISAALEFPEKPVVSVSGDGGFLFSGAELETAVRLNLNIVQVIFNDGYYDMVKFQEVAKYGKDAGVTLGKVDFAQYAESFGAHGHTATTKEELISALKAAKSEDGPSVIDVPVDYSDNIKLKSTLLDDILN
ncbi:acetolactate synthase [Lentilactobacillus curieae]|uniref:Acetolactate synthase n=1 Tax=Lentilactobacillus curieae TaxID=1138822 RepID=A0A1S6QG92_9LACO|nr:acetolactate synthase AlsS [Lentilactobacillus curieae]AQW20622.1 acetolactate synthase [Lentilactobacillus curieae]